MAIPELAAAIAVSTVRSAVSPPRLRKSLFCCFSSNDFAVYEQALGRPAS
jgi:hypothetical protein